MKMQIKKHLKPKKIILTLCIVWIIYLIGIPLYYTPYALQPSYWEFKKLCEINNLPDGEEKYNKILNFYGTDLDTLDYDKFQETTTLNWYQQKRPIKKIKYGENRYIYPSLAILYDDHIGNRIDTITEIEFNSDKPQGKQHITRISMKPQWQTWRVNNIEFNEGNGDFRMPTTKLGCDYFLKDK